MSESESTRAIHLIDAQTPGRPLVTAQLRVGFPPERLDEVEAGWSVARRQVTESREQTGLEPLDHGHWDWRRKADSVRTGYHLLYAVECGDEVQGLMAVKSAPRPGRLGGGPVVYVDYLEAAPWNLDTFTSAPRFGGVGTALLVEAIRLSRSSGLGGRVGLHALPRAESFYARRGMTDWGTDTEYFGLVYYEFTGERAAHLMARHGEG